MKRYTRVVADMVASSPTDTLELMFWKLYQCPETINTFLLVSTDIQPAQYLANKRLPSIKNIIYLLSFVFCDDPVPLYDVEALRMLMKFQRYHWLLVF